MTGTPQPAPTALRADSRRSKQDSPTIRTTDERRLFSLLEKAYVSSQGGVSIDLDANVVELGLETVKKKYNISK